MRLVILLAFALPASSGPARPPTPSLSEAPAARQQPARASTSLPLKSLPGRRGCPPTPGLDMASMEGETARSRRLGELPPGATILAVWREIDGCPIPAVIRRDVAAPGR